MRVHLPESILNLIKKHQLRGDFAAISRQLTKSEDLPEGDETRQQEVSNTISKGSGKYDAVKAITEFYTERDRLSQSLSIAS